jgi:hypothetical protein
MSFPQPELRLQIFKNDSTLQLFLRNGPFWNAVNNVRKLWRIEAFPGIARGREDLEVFGTRMPEPGEIATDPAVQIRLIWEISLSVLHNEVIPLEHIPFGSRRVSVLMWHEFLAQCVLFDPPPFQLLDYAKTGTSMAIGLSMVDPNSLIDSSVKLSPSSSQSSELVVNPPLVQWVEPNAALLIERNYWNQVLGEIARRHLAPQGIELETVLQEIKQETSFVGEHAVALASLPLHDLILVSPQTTQDEVTSAFRMIADLRPARARVGRSPIDDLTAVECANRKRTGWTYVQISEHYGFPMSSDSYDKQRRANSAISHVKRGETILSRRENSSE